MNQPLIEIRNLTKMFARRTALKQVEGTIPRGKIVGLVGPDGAGKTTLIRLIAGLLTPTEGQISVLGCDSVQQAESIHLQTGYMPQKFGLYEELTVQQNLDLYADLRGVFGEERNKTFEELLRFTNLEKFSATLAKNLSGGMKQKLGLACSLLKKPLLLLLDEPSVGVDPISRRELWHMVSSLVKEGISVVWSTAYLDEAEQCDLVFLLNEGELLYQGDPKRLTETMEGRVFFIHPTEGDRRKLLFSFLKDPNVVDGMIHGQGLRIVLNEGRSLSSSLSMKPLPPRFEDAFMDRLKRASRGESKLAERAPFVKGNGKPAIVVEGLTKQFGAFTAVDHISLSVGQGEVFGLLGPNGAGKTTTFRMLCGLLSPTKGNAWIHGLNLQEAPSEARGKIGYMAQKFSLYGNLSVSQNLSFFAGIYNLQGTVKQQAIEEMIEVFNLQEYLSFSAETLPLGYKQRLSLACACMHHPDLLFLDEPTSGVDPATRREFWNHINGLVAKGVTIMITTHFMEEAEYCDRIGLVYQGKIIQMDSPQGLKNRSVSEKHPNPSLEDAFIQMIEEYAHG